MKRDLASLSRAQGRPCFFLILLVLLLYGAIVDHLEAALPAFPGAEGFGAFTPGGRGGDVIEVTNLNDSGPGSLRAAIEASGPRIVVFRIGGEIQLQSPMVIKAPYITIAGQTAPGDGITLRRDMVTVATHDVIIQYIRVRVGDEGSPTSNRDGLNISTTKSDTDVYNVIIDHCSVSWGIDENLSTWTASSKPYKTHDITIQWSIISEALNDSIHIDEGQTQTAPHSMGMILGKNGFNLSVHHTLFHSNRDRNPYLKGMLNTELVNNLISNWGDGPTKLSSGQSTTHILNNYYKAGLTSRSTEIWIGDVMPPDSKIYIAGNIADDPRHNHELFEPRVLNRSNFPLHTGLIFTPSTITLSSAQAVYDLIIDSAGVIVPVRDRVDARIVREVRSRSGMIIDSQNEVGGWPTLASGVPPLDSDHDGMPNAWEISRGLNPADANDGRQASPSGYTWIEVYIHSLIPNPQDGLPPSPPKNLRVK